MPPIARLIWIGALTFLLSGFASQGEPLHTMLFIVAGWCAITAWVETSSSYAIMKAAKDAARIR